MLSSQGWTPGSTLGSTTAQHKAHFTQASHSHIRVVLRDDNLGLGAQKGRADTDVFGLDMFQGLLGRLNGKSQEELEKEGAIRRDVLLGSVGRERYGDGMFVRGGWLVGDKIEDVVSVEEAERLAEVRLAHERRVEEGKSGEVEGEGKRRKRDEEEGRKTEKKSKKRKSTAIEEEESNEESAKKSNKDKKRKSEVTSTSSSDPKSEKKRLKSEKRARKEARRIRREQKALKKSSRSNSSSSSSPEPPSAQQAAAQQALSARFATRQRYIQQKRMATMDQTALNEIFMIKSKS
jgi:Pin2-interacting protein X1